MKPRPIMERLLEGLDRSGGPDACWPWTRACDKVTGYGIVRVAGRTRTVHRVMLEQTLGRPLGPLFALHHCDNRPCANPAHLYAGTQKQNFDDMVRRGRWVRPPRIGPHPPILRGEDSPTSVLTEAAVRAIRADRETGASYDVLAARYGVSRSTISQVVRRVTWREVV